MSTTLFFLVRHGVESSIFALAYFAVILAMVVGVILWERRFRRQWQQFRARSWRQVVGRFDEGEVITMRKGGSHAISGYEVWVGYDYEADGDQTGIYALPFSSEFPTSEEAEKSRNLVAHKSVIVRVSARNPKRSCILDEDVMPLITAAGGTSATPAAMR
jgi:hypothetical protein